MGITVKIKSKEKASVKLYNHIVSYLFEQEHDELKNNTDAKNKLKEAKDALAKIIKENG